MTVAELITLLQKVDPTLRVLVVSEYVGRDVDPEFTGVSEEDDDLRAFYIESMDTEDDS